MLYITKADVATFLNLTLTSSGEAIVDAIIPAVEACAESYCNRTWNNGATDLVETFDGGIDALFPRQTPIDTIVGITNDGESIDTEDIYNYGTHIRLGYTPYRQPRAIVVTYQADNPLPADLKHALIRWTADIFKSSEDAGKTAKSVAVGPMRVDFLAQDGIPAYVELVLNRYRLTPL